jgi:hypothetical protein
MEPKVEPKQKLENAFRNTRFRTKLIDLTAKVLKLPAMMEYVNKLTNDPALKTDFADIKKDIATFGIDPLPRSVMVEPLPTPLPMPEREPAAGLEIKPANASDELKAGRVMMAAVEQEHAKANEETKKKRTAVERAQKAEAEVAAKGVVPGIPSVIEALEQQLTAAVQYEEQLAEIRKMLEPAVTKAEEAEIAAEAAAKGAGAPGGKMITQETEEAMQQLAHATTIARTNLERLIALRPAAPVRGGRNRRTKKNNYYRKRRRTTHNRSRRNLN